MKRLIVVACISSWSLAGVALAQPLSGTTGQDDSPRPVKSVAPSAWNASDPALPPPLPVAPAPSVSSVPQPTPVGSPGETQASPETRAHEYHLMQAQAAEESVHRAAVARADQRHTALGIATLVRHFKQAPSASVDPYDGDYAAYWASNYPYYPLRWVGSGEPWGFVETQP